MSQFDRSSKYYYSLSFTSTIIVDLLIHIIYSKSQYAIYNRYHSTTHLNCPNIYEHQFNAVYVLTNINDYYYVIIIIIIKINNSNYICTLGSN